MTLYEYNALDELEQWETLWDCGVHIVERDQGGFQICTLRPGFILCSVAKIYMQFLQKL